MSDEIVISGEMDPRLADALTAANYRITLANQRKNAKLKLQRYLTFPKNGGMFFVDRELVSFVQSLILAGKDSTILLDSNDNPIEINNLDSFFEEIYERYYNGLQDYLSEYNAFKKARNVEKLIFEK